LAKFACGAFADWGFVAAGKRRDFCRLRRLPDKLLDLRAFHDFHE
jgi:hypothetical protein